MASIISGLLAFVTIAVTWWFFSGMIIWGFDANLWVIRELTGLTPSGFGSQIEVIARVLNLERILLFFEVSLVWRFVLSRIGL